MFKYIIIIFFNLTIVLSQNIDELFEMEMNFIVKIIIKKQFKIMKRY